MKTGTDAVFSGLFARIKHPVAGVLLFVWPLYNWDVWPHWFADTPASAKIKAIKGALSDGWCTRSDYWFPWVIALGVVLLTPVLGWVLALARERPDQARHTAEGNWRSRRHEEAADDLERREADLRAGWESHQIEKNRVERQEAQAHELLQSTKEKSHHEVQALASRVEELTRHVDKLQGDEGALTAKTVELEKQKNSLLGIVRNLSERKDELLRDCDAILTHAGKSSSPNSMDRESLVSIAGKAEALAGRISRILKSEDTF